MPDAKAETDKCKGQLQITHLFVQGQLVGESTGLTENNCKITRWPRAQLENNFEKNCKMAVNYSNLVRLVHWTARDARGPGRESPTYFTSCEDSHRQLSVPLHSWAELPRRREEGEASNFPERPAA